MQHPFAALEPEYLDLLGRCVVTREAEARAAAARIIKLMPRYKAVSAKTGVPAVWLAAVNDRESSSSFLTYFGNGDRLSRPTLHVPAQRARLPAPLLGKTDVAMPLRSIRSHLLRIGLGLAPAMRTNFGTASARGHTVGIPAISGLAHRSMMAASTSAMAFGPRARRIVS